MSLEEKIKEISEVSFMPYSEKTLDTDMKALAKDLIRNTVDEIEIENFIKCYSKREEAEIEFDNFFIYSSISDSKSHLIITHNTIGDLIFEDICSAEVENILKNVKEYFMSNYQDYIECIRNDPNIIKTKDEIKNFIESYRKKEESTLKLDNYFIYSKFSNTDQTFCISCNIAYEERYLELENMSYEEVEDFLEDVEESFRSEYTQKQLNRSNEDRISDFLEYYDCGQGATMEFDNYTLDCTHYSSSTLSVTHKTIGDMTFEKFSYETLENLFKNSEGNFEIALFEENYRIAYNNFLENRVENLKP